MSESFRKQKFTNISNVLPKVVENLGLDRRLNEEALFCLWSSLLSPSYAERSIPLYIDRHNILIVAVEDSSIAQELSFLKPKLIKRLREIAVQFGLNIEGLRFDIRQFAAIKMQQTQTAAQADVIGQKTILDVKNEQLKDIVLSAQELDEIENFKDAMLKASLAMEQLNPQGTNLVAQRVANLVEKRLRLKKWHKSNNLPFCKLCQEPLFQADIDLCPFCLQSRQTES